jgi:group I intron endonuclease
MKVYIYVLKHPITNDIRYVGQAVDLKKRLDHHIQTSKVTNRHISNWIKSLPNKPIIEVIEECDNTNSNERERYWIKHYRDLGLDLCNHSNGGEGAGIGNTNCLGRKLSEETKEKLRRANKQGKKTLHISSGKIYNTLKEACKELNIAYVNEFMKLKRGTSKTFAYLS